ncbi:MAG TPA: LuxR family transcriptional regulator, partial [Cyanobacteria bacterium UBA11162]|nr:LuxR family transcriptional regulator [Cyanobacteria bacterium UBA11162]
FTRDVSDVIEDILERLSELEQRILYQLVVKREPVVFKDLQKSFAEVSTQELIGGVASLLQRSLIERSEGGFTLPPAIMEVTIQLMTDLQE